MSNRSNRCKQQQKCIKLNINQNTKNRLIFSCKKIMDVKLPQVIFHQDIKSPNIFQAKNNRSQLTTNKTYLKQIVVTLKLNTVKAA
jgi:hypothetical protein